jgi:hypothetical protein
MQHVIPASTFRVGVIFLAIFFSVLPVRLAAQLSTRFSPLNYDQLAATAEAQDKLFVLYFHADWVAPCQYLTENVWCDVAVAELLNRRFLIKQVGVDENGEAELAHRFRVEHIPSLLLFSANGQLVERIETALEPGELYRRLLELDVPANHLNPVAAIGSQRRAGAIPRAPQPSFRIRPQPARPPAMGTTTTSGPAVGETEATTPRSTPEIFQSRTAPRYGWLVVVPFASREAATATIEEWIGRTGINAEVREQTNENGTVYRVIFGPFSSIAQAEAAVDRLAKLGREMELQVW